MSLFNEGIAYTMTNVYTVKIFMHMYRMQPNWAMLIHCRCRVLTKKLEKVLKNLTVTSKKQNKTNKL